jgi:hypothetical protein
MTRLADVADKIRSKNAGPFWLTIDIFCTDAAGYERISAKLGTKNVASLFPIDPETLKRFDLPDLNVVKFSLPRPNIQGTAADRDMHGASFANLLADIEV